MGFGASKIVQVQVVGKLSAIERTDVSTSTAGSWVDVDCSSIVPKGTKAVQFIWTAGNYDRGRGVRKNGATDEGTYFPGGRYAHSPCGVGGIVELDDNGIFEQKIASTTVKLAIVGYFL